MIKYQWPLQLSWFFLSVWVCSNRQQKWPVALWMFLWPRDVWISLSLTLFYSGRIVPCSRSDKPVDRVPRWWQQLKALIRSQPEGWVAHTKILLMPHQNMFPKIHEKKDTASGMTSGHSDESLWERKCVLTPLFCLYVLALLVWVWQLEEAGTHVLTGR